MKVRSLRFKLQRRIFFLMLIAAAITFFLTGIVIFLYTSQASIENYQREAKEQMALYEARLDSFFAKEIDFLTSIHQLGRGISPMKIIETIEKNPLYIDTQFLSPLGFVKNSSRPHLLGYDYSGQDIYKRVLETREPLIDMTITPRTTESMIIALPLFNENIIDYIALHHLCLMKIEEQISQDLFFRESEILVINKDGLVTLKIPSQRVRTSLTLFDYGLQLTEFLDQRGSFIQKNNEQYLITYDRVKYFDGFLITRLNMQAIDDTMRGFMRSMVFGLLGVFLLFLIFAIIQANRAAKPLEELSLQVEESIRGERDRVTIKEGSELSILAQAFNESWETNQKMQKDILEAKEMAEEASRAKSQFLANVSHEIRTPMNTILGIAQLLEETPLDETQKKYLASFQRTGDILLRLINDILDFSKIEAKKLSPEIITFSTQEFFQSIIHIYRLKANQKGLWFTDSIPDHIPDYLKGDPIRINQILGNILDNAIKFTPDGGITFLITYDESTSLCKVSIGDTGIGIPLAKKELIFDSFTQADPSITRNFGGTGLGLSISLGLLEILGGTISLESEVGKGTAFDVSFFLPKGEKSQVEGKKGIVSEDKSTKAPPILERSLRILLVEDNTDNQYLILQFFKKTPYTIEVASNGEEALEKHQNSNYDLILMDMQMPILDGFSATKSIRERGDEKTPILGLSAYSEPKDIERAMEAGCNDYLTKPVHKRILYQKVYELTSEKKDEEDTKKNH